ncbi:hypothetical protein R1flu_006972 [Riccia fluitans]|uniref:BZIP domain-containing protein n=1 Tax=Riccia fluitans TaxID=41844 RepID=A0ABD1YXI7_9MARC
MSLRPFIQWETEGKNFTLAKHGKASFKKKKKSEMSWEKFTRRAISKVQVGRWVGLSNALAEGELVVSSFMEFDELVNELVNWEEVDLVLEDAVVLDNGKEGFSDTWKSWTPSEFECLSPSAVLEFADKREECESFGRVDHHAPDTFLDYGVPADDVSPGVSSPGSCLSAPEAAGYGVPPGHEFGPESFRPDSSGARIDLELKEVSLGNLSCGESYPEFKSSSPESGCNSHSDDQVQAQERSRGQTANRGTGHEQDASPPMDEEAKRKMRLMRNRESATQSRLRKKSYIKELEMKCRMLESHCSMLQQTVAFTSRENVLLRDELNKIKCSNMNGSKSGVVEPAALPSDSLPSESPRRLTSLGPFRLANWELLACLYLVLLLPITGMKVQSPERGESRERRRRCMGCASVAVRENDHVITMIAT